MGQRPWTAKETTSELTAIIAAHNNLYIEHQKLKKRFYISIIAGILIYSSTLGFLLL